MDEMKRPELPSWVVFWNVNPDMRSGTQWVGTGHEFFDHEGCAKTRYEELNGQGHVATLRQYYPTDAQYLGAAHEPARKWAKHFRETILGLRAAAKCEYCEELYTCSCRATALSDNGKRDDDLVNRISRSMRLLLLEFEDRARNASR